VVVIDEVAALVAGGNPDAAVELVQRDGAPADVAARFSALVRDLYWTAKDLPSVVVVARGGIQYCLRMMAEATSADARASFGGFAQVIANNLGSFTWPGWDEPGMAPGPDDLAAGRDAAELNLKLATELGYSAVRVQNAHWLLGAHLLAAGDAEGALAEFEQCNPVSRALFAGYVTLAEVVLGRAGAQRTFDDVLDMIEARGGDDAALNRSQLATAHRVFAPSRGDTATGMR
jgi:hypothetical protein